MMEAVVLDKGYLRLVDSWGSDERVIEAARMSTGKGFQGWGPIHAAECDATNPDTRNACACSSTKPGDEKLLRYLWEHQHTTPFEMAGATFEVKAPIFVFREWHRHRTQSYNEMSSRYTPLPGEDYSPGCERLLTPANSSKQSSQAVGAPVADESAAWAFAEELRELQDQAERTYQMGLRLGIPKELARLALTVGRYSRMRASANLLNWLKFMRLRQAEGAQWEIRQYALAMGDMMKGLFPRTYALFEEAKR